MSLRDNIVTNYKNSLKSKDKSKISTYRLILSGIKDVDISNRSGSNKKETNDEDIKKLLKKMIKQRSESIEIYKNSIFLLGLGKILVIQIFVKSTKISIKKHIYFVTFINKFWNISTTLENF